MDGVDDRISRCRRGRKRLEGLFDHPVTIAELNLHPDRLPRRIQVLNKAIDIQAGMRRQHIFRLGKNILDKGRRNDAKRDFAVDAAKSQVVDLVAERRDVRTLGRVNIHGQHVLSVEIHVRGQVKRKRRVPALVLSQARAVDPYRGSGHDAFKIHEDAMAAGFGRKFEAPAIAGDELVVLFVETVPGQADVGVRNDDALISRVVEIPSMRAFHHGAAVAPVAIHRKHEPALGGVGFGCSAGKWGASDRGPRDESAGSSQKVASIHSFPCRCGWSRWLPVNYLTLVYFCKRLHKELGCQLCDASKAFNRKERKGGPKNAEKGL